MEKNEVGMLTIIIPAYKCLNTLPKTLASIVAQTDLEGVKVFIVDDGNEDIYGRCIKPFMYFLDIEYIKNPRNMGVGVSRQNGLDRVTTEYVMFVDADDYLTPNAVANFKEHIKSKPNVYVSRFSYYSENGSEILYDTTSTTWLHGKAYKVSFLRAFRITFPPVRANEDAGFNNAVFAITKNIAYDKHVNYIWQYNPNSITNVAKSKNALTLDYLRAIIYSIRVATVKTPIEKMETLPYIYAAGYYYHEYACLESDNEMQQNILQLFSQIDKQVSDEWKYSPQVRANINHHLMSLMQKDLNSTELEYTFNGFLRELNKIEKMQIVDETGAF